VISSLYCQQIW